MMTTSIRRRTVLGLAAAAACTAGLPAFAQTASGQPLRVILPVGAGSGVDAIVRAIGPSLSNALSRPVVIENMPGAGGITGTLAIVKAPADGSTVGIVSNNHAVNPSVYPSMPFDSLADITPISVIGATPFVLVVNPERLPASNVKELVDLLKAKPGAYNYASSGNGTILHLAAAMFLDQAGVQVQHVPYKGVGPMITDLIGGQVDLGVLAVPAVQGQLAQGRLRAIGLGTRARIPQLPDLPTVAEQGMPDYEIGGWFAMVAPAKLPAADVKRFHEAIVTAMQNDDVKAAMAKQANVVNPTTPEQAARFMRAEQERYAALVKRAGIKVD